MQPKNTIIGQGKLLSDTSGSGKFRHCFECNTRLWCSARCSPWQARREVVMIIRRNIHRTRFVRTMTLSSPKGTTYHD